VTVDEDAVMVTTGSSAAFVLGFIAAFDAGDRVAIATPGYPCYRNILEALGVEVVSVPVDASTNFQPTPALLDAVLASDPRPLKGLIVASPSNPTGTVLSESELFALHRWCAERRAWFVSDEIYHQIEYGSERARTALESPGASDTALVINSCSKYHCLTGWRVGWCVVPPALRETMRALQQNLFINAPHVSQIAATRAFDCDEELQKHVERYRENREILLEGLPKAGFTKLSSAGGAYYIYADVSHLTDDSVGLCRRILDVTGVACVPGVDFDRERGKAFVRFSFCDSTETAREAVRVLAEKRDQWQK
jgi:aspartate/methionine/tyrosine aminotransferase